MAVVGVAFIALLTICPVGRFLSFICLVDDFFEFAVSLGDSTRFTAVIPLSLLLRTSAGAKLFSDDFLGYETKDLAIFLA